MDSCRVAATLDKQYKLIDICIYIYRKKGNVNINEFIDEPFEYVLTVCDSANELCPVFPNGKNRIHNAFVDPSRSSYDSDEHALEVYRNTVKEISSWIDSLSFTEQFRFCKN